MPLKPCRSCRKLSNESLCESCRKGRENTRSRSRAVTEPGRAIYKTKQGQDARTAAIARDGSCRALRNGEPCGSTTGLEVHHIQPLRDGGKPFDLGNLITLCLYCHIGIERQNTTEINNEELSICTNRRTNEPPTS